MPAQVHAFNHPAGQKSAGDHANADHQSRQRIFPGQQAIETEHRDLDDGLANTDDGLGRDQCAAVQPRAKQCADQNSPGAGHAAVDHTITGANRRDAPGRKAETPAFEETAQRDHADQHEPEQTVKGAFRQHFVYCDAEDQPGDGGQVELHPDPKIDAFPESPDARPVADDHGHGHHRDDRLDPQYRCQ